MLPDVIVQLGSLGLFPFLRDCEYAPDQFNVLFINRILVDDALLDKLAATFYRELQPPTN